MIKNINKFFNQPFTISRLTNRMGVRLEGNSINATKSHNIDSEGIVKGSVQVPGSGDPIVLINDHPTIGGYPKIATVILSDLAKLSQMPLGTRFNFQEITLKQAEKINKINFSNFKNQLKKIKIS